MNISQWIAAGRPARRRRDGNNAFGCDCDARLELEASPADRAAWNVECSLCKKGNTLNENRAFIPGQGFAGAGTEAEVAAGGYLPVRYKPPPELPPPQAVPAQTSVNNMVAGPSLGLNGSAPPPAQPIGSSTLGGIVMGLTPSVCKGPYNRQGTMCVPKPDCKSRDPSDPCISYSLVGSLIDNGIEIISGPGAPGLTDPGYTNLTGTDPCPTGYAWDGSQCIATGVGGAAARILPGGATGTGADVYGQAVMGAFGRPALQPYVTQQVVRRCPAGSVLGKDGLCYDRIANSDRMWPRGARPMLTGGEMKTLRRAEVLKRKVKKLATSSGFTCRKR